MRAIVGGAPVARESVALDDETVLVAGAQALPARNPDASVNALIEIPAGTTAKFELDGNHLRWQKRREDGERRAIDYLPFVVNYGMVPSTLAADGDALDVVVLGRSIERGHSARTRVIGVMMMESDGVRDDKLIAVPLEPEWKNGFSELHDLDELDASYPAARELIETWFSFYWGPGVTHVIGWGDAAEAEDILDDAIVEPARTARRESSALRLRAEPRCAPLVHASPAQPILRARD
jgi:inorganic pyrophosphatase